MPKLLRLRTRFRPIVVPLIAIAATGALVGASPALATNEGFSCWECTHVTNKENWVKNVESYNFSGLGTCDYLWRNNGGKWEKLINSCVNNTHGQLLCLPFELVSHGETTRTFNFLYNLWNRQDNFAGCE